MLTLGGWGPNCPPDTRLTLEQLARKWNRDPMFGFFC